jgi:hypothetical protein
MHRCPVAMRGPRGPCRRAIGARDADVDGGKCLSNMMIDEDSDNADARRGRGISVANRG